MGGHGGEEDEEGEWECERVLNGDEHEVGDAL